MDFNHNALYKIIIAIILTGFLSVGWAEAFPVEKWNRTFGGPGRDYAYSAIEIADGYMIAGYTADFSAWLIKIDKNGNEMWNRTYGESCSSFYSILQTADGYILAGESNNCACILKTDFDGNKIWSRISGDPTYGGTNSFFSILKIADGYVLAGEYTSIAYSWGGAWLFKTDLYGNEIWNRSLGARRSGRAYSVQQTDDGYIIAAAFSSMGGGSDGRLIKTDFNGNNVWNRTFKGPDDGESFSSIQITDDGYIISGKKRTVPMVGYNAWLIKTDKSGNEMWNITYGGQNVSSASSVKVTPDGYIVSGDIGAISYSGNYYSDAWLFKTDKNGKELWNLTIDRSNYDTASSVLKTADGYILTGSAGGDAWIIKVIEKSNNMVTNPSASHEIPEDTDNEPLWGETAMLNVTVTNSSEIAGVTIDLSSIGGSPQKPMSNTGGNTWSVTTNASAGTPPGTYDLRVNATSIYGFSNTSVTIAVKVIKNGDTTGNGAVNIGDALRLANNVSFSGNPSYALSSIYVADVTGNGILNIGDALRLANNVSFPGNPSYILK